MAYYLRQDKKKKGTYLQMYESYWGKEKKQPRSRHIRKLWVCLRSYFDLIIRCRFTPDSGPGISYYRNMLLLFQRKEQGTRRFFVADKTRPSGHPLSFHAFIMVFPFPKIRFTMDVLLSENPIKNILNCSTIVMKIITSVTSAVLSLTAQTTTLKLTFRRKIKPKR